MKQKSLHIILIFLALACISLVTLLPFVYQSQTLWYKFGIDRTLLLIAQVCGLYAGILVLLQIVLVSKVGLLVDLYGPRRLQQVHQFIGKLIPIVILLHVLLVLVPEGIGNLPIGKKFWPEMVGAGVFMLTILLAVSVWLRKKLSLSYRWWKVIHRTLGVSALLGLSVHVAFVSDSFEQQIPLWGLIFFITAVSTLFVWGKINR